MKYKTGDRVIGITTNASGKNINNLKGTIKGEVTDIGSICVEFDKNIGGHSAGALGKKGHCWWVNGHTEVKRICTDKIVITTDGTETLARLYEGGKVVASAKATCSREDEFNFNIGARLAFDRLANSTAEKKEEYYNGKVVCVDLNGANERAYTVGKIYQFVDGQLTDDSGDKIPMFYCNRIESFEDWKKFSASKFIEVVE